MMRSQLRIPTRLADRNRTLPPRFGGEPPLQPPPPPSPPPPPPPPTREEITPSSGWTEDSNSHYLLIQLPDFKQEEIKMQIQGGPDRLINISGERKAAAAAGDQNIIFFDKTYTVPDINADVEKTSFQFNGGTFTVTIPKRLPPPPPPPPSPVHEHVQETVASENDTNDLSSDIGDLETTASDGGGDEKLKYEEHQKRHETSEVYLKKESDDGEHEKQLKDQHHQEEEEKLEDDDEEQHHQLYQQQNENNKTTNSVKEEEEEETQKKGNEKNQLSSAAQMICKSKNTIFISIIAFCLGVLVSRKMGH